MKQEFTGRRPRRSANERRAANAIRSILGLGAVLAAGLALAGCDKPVQADKNVIRAIKWMKTEDGVARQERRIAGIVEPVKVTRIGLEVGGRLQKLHVKLGDRVKTGDLLAELDPQPFQLQVRQARAEVAAANAAYKEELQNLERQQILFNKGWIAKARLDSAVAGHDAARSQLGARQAQLDLRRRDLNLAVLKAPFDGVVSRKMIDNFEEVAVGQPILELNGEQNFKVTLRVPPALIERVAQGQRVAVQFPSEAGLVVSGRVTEIGSRAEAGNAFPVTVTLAEGAQRLRAGLSAEVVFTLDEGGRARAGVMVPMGAILSGKGQDYHVFKYDAESSTVRQVPVQIADLHDNEVQITSDLKAGTIIATAGVEFLSDGQAVRLMDGDVPFGEGVVQ